MTPVTPPTAADALQALLGQPVSGLGSAASWPAAHRLLATTAGMLLCVLAAVGCTETRHATTTQAVAPTYSYLQDAPPESHEQLWTRTALGQGTLLAGSPRP